MEQDDASLRDEGRSNGDCTCVGTCVGFECLKQRSTALVSHGRHADACALLEHALADSTSHSAQAELRTLYDIVVDRRERSVSRSASRSADQRVAGEAETGGGGGGGGKRRRVEDVSMAAAVGEDFDCVICSKLFFEPVTTPCGHTFCRNCLARAMDFTDKCPMCRTVLHLEDPTALAITNVLRSAIQHLFPDEYESRRKEALGDAPSAENAMTRLPLFPLNAVVFPMQRFPMHIFEARYRLMLRRIMQGSRKFGLIALKRSHDGNSELCSIGCVLEVTKADRFPDGRSLIETVARERFKVHGRNEVDGYLVGRTEVYEDIEDADTDEDRAVENRVREIVDRLMERGSRMSVMQGALQRAGDVPTREQGPGALGMWLAGMLVSDDSERQHMLEMQSSSRRLREMVAILERFLESMNAAANASGGGGRDCSVQ